jgi:CRP-like cAMP-binding protein
MKAVDKIGQRPQTFGDASLRTIKRREAADANATVVPLKNPQDRRSNRLLALLRAEDRERLYRHLEPALLEYEHPLYDANQRIEFVYFIETGVGSLVLPLANGRAVEVGTIGNEGFVGLPVLLGDEKAPTGVYIQVPGVGLRMTAEVFREELARSDPMHATMCRYGHVFFNQVASRTALLPMDADDA